MTELTKRMIVKAGWPREQVIAMPPGLSAIEENAQNELPIKELNNALFDQLYVLYLGNSLPVRGIDVLVSAARRVFAQSKNVKIVCLLRPDPGEGMRIARERILHRVNNLGLDGQFVCITRKLEPHEVRQTIKNARAVVMPFLFVPSEIPLGVLEAMQLGTPVITTRSGGTSEYVGDGGWIVTPGNVMALAKAITSALHDDKTRRRKAAVCLATMANHPTWEEVGDTWLECGSSVLKRFTA